MTEEGDDETDPLDAFMAGIEVSLPLHYTAAVEVTVGMSLSDQTEIVKQKTKKKSPPPK